MKEFLLFMFIGCFSAIVREGIFFVDCATTHEAHTVFGKFKCELIEKKK